MRWVRAGLAVLAVAQLTVGGAILLAPHTFYANGWVAMHEPYNGHLLLDVGALNLALAVPLCAAACCPGRQLVRVALSSVLVYGVLHVAVHATHLSHFGAVEAITQLGVLSLQAILAVVLLLATTRWPSPAGDRTGKDRSA